MKLQEDWHKTADIVNDHGQGDPFAAAVRWSRMPMVFADPRQVDTPLVYANNSFCQLTGYELDEIVGRNCRFLQGPETNPETVAKIGEALGAGRAIGIDILNYRKDGSTFWNALYISPVINDAGELLFFFASQFDASERREAFNGVQLRKSELEIENRARTKELEKTLHSLELALSEKTLLLHEVDHRVKNNLQTISTLIAMHSRTLNPSDPQATFRLLQDRVDALSSVHRQLNSGGIVSTFNLSELIGDLGPEIIKAHARSPVDLQMDLQPIPLSNKFATPLGLIVNELMTNAVRHAWREGQRGTLKISTRMRARQAVLSISDDGQGMPPNVESRPLSGLKLSEALVRQIRGTVEYPATQNGTTIEIGIPVHD